MLTQGLRGAVRNFIKYTNLDTYECLCRIYDFVAAADPGDRRRVQEFSQDMRRRVDSRSHGLRLQGERLLERLEAVYRDRDKTHKPAASSFSQVDLPLLQGGPEPYAGLGALAQSSNREMLSDLDLFGLAPEPIPYDVFKRQLSSHS